MSTPTAVAVAIAMWAGCLVPLAAPLAAVALLVLSVAALRCARGHTAVALVLVIVGMFVLGGALAGGRAQLRQASPLHALAERATTRQLSGRIVAEPRTTPYGRWVLVRVTTVGATRVVARAVLHLPSDEAAEVGTGVAGRMRIVALPDGAFGDHLRSSGAVVALRPLEALRSTPAPAVLRSTTAVRRRGRAVFRRALPQRQAALLSGLVLGVRDGVPTDDLRAAGLSHLVVVSGRHVAVLLAVLLAVVAALRMGHRGAHRVALVGLWWFVLLTRWQPSVLRAAGLATIVLVAALRGRARDTVHALAVTVLLLLLVDPLLVRQVGFTLSVLATAGVVLAVRPRDGDRPRGVALAVRATLGAQVATAPVILSLAGAVPTAALPANLIGAPAAAIAQSLGVLATALALVTPSVATVIARAAAVPLAVLEWSATAFLAVPALDGRALVAVSVLALLTAVGRRRGGGRPRFVRAAPATIVIVIVGLLAVGYRPPAAPRALRLVVTDVDQGDALIVEAPGGGTGARMVVDGGPAPDGLIGALRARRIRTLAAVVLTHGDHDHAGGLVRVLDSVRVGVLLVPAGEVAMRDAAPSARAAVDAARAAGVPVVAVHAGQRFPLGSAQVDVLAPTDWSPPGADRNSRSIVLRVTGAHGSMLLTGDVDESAQLRLLGRRDLLRADVLKVPHHGGATNAHGFLDAVAARVAVVSVGADNRYGHPHPTTLDDLHPVPLWRTDVHGTVTVELTPDGPAVTSTRPRGG